MNIINNITVYLTPYGQYSQDAIPADLHNRFAAAPKRRNGRPDRRYALGRDACAAWDEIMAWSRKMWDAA